MKFSPQFMATHLAAVPHRDPEQACRLILQNFPEAPCIPRLTKSTRMYLEGIPCLVVDREKRRLWFDISPQREHELLDFYEKYLVEDLGYFAISREWAEGMYTMLEMLQKHLPSQLKLLHIQTPGPISWGLSVTDNKNIPAFYNETMRDILVKTLAMKAKWQERKIKDVLPGVQTMVDFAEPALNVHTSAIGSGVREHIIASLNEVLGAVVEGPEATAEAVAWADLLLVTGTTLVNGTINDFLDHKPVLFYGTTIAGAAHLMNWDRFCAKST